eukprot:GFUD01038190.1.p2 GENE.GFUD01038190.1~~GFUD01038190.1.p2  ORF type:complete len:131 (+),score=41.92 GFUD01038190.1:646-1038(+)
MTRQSLSPDQSLNTGRRSLSSDGMSTLSSLSSTDWGYTSYSSFTANKSYHTNHSYSRSAQDNKSSEEPDEQDYGYPGYNKGNDNAGKVSLGALKTPEISAWDKMGILGLSSKMFSSSSLMRKESVSSHAM